MLKDIQQPYIMDWCRLTLKNLFPLSDAGSRFPLAQALGWHRRGHGVVVLIVAVGSLASVAVELQLVAVINNLPAQAKYVVCPVPGAIVEVINQIKITMVIFAFAMCSLTYFQYLSYVEQSFWLHLSMISGCGKINNFTIYQ